MHRTAYATGGALVAVLAVGLAACTGDSGAGGQAAESRTGTVSASASSAPPGTFRDLPEPCGTVGQELLGDLLPGADSPSATSSESATPKTIEGEPAVTFDTDRRVGCRWKNATGLGTRHLLIDFERVVSYDLTVSDDDKAEQLYDRRALEAGIPAADPETSEPQKPKKQEKQEKPGGEPGRPETSGESGSALDASDNPGSPQQSGSSGSPDEAAATAPATPDAALSPRPLNGLGNAAFINDELVTTDSGVHRDITLVFRAANVIVTIEYEQWVTDKRRIPASGELQDKARELAEKVAGRFDG